jgi:hypothetical protein
MMKFKIILTLAIALVSSTGYGGQKELERPTSISLDSTQMDTTLSNTGTKYVFTFRNMWTEGLPRKTNYSIDGEAFLGTIEEGTRLTVLTTPGNHVFQFFYSPDYFEVYSDSLHSSGGFVSNYSVYLQESNMQIMSEKPIIYLYPETDTTVSVKLDVKGKLTFSYPEYKDGWEFTASPNGDLTFGEDTYNYLFWESSQRYSLENIDYSSGFYVNGRNATSFLEKILTEAGLNSKEQTDFITYWAPRLAQNENNFVHFVLNEDCNRFAQLDITPKPDNINRIYMLWQPVDAGASIGLQSIPVINREGFDVLEWGGQELPKLSFSSSNN